MSFPAFTIVSILLLAHLAQCQISFPEGEDGATGDVSQGPPPGNDQPLPGRRPPPGQRPPGGGRPGPGHGPRGQEPGPPRGPGLRRGQGPSGNPGAQIFFPRAERVQKVPCTTASDQPGHCRHLVRCAIYSRDITELTRSPCAIDADTPGVCCPVNRRKANDTNTIVRRRPRPTVPRPNVSQREITFAIEESQSQSLKRDDKERELVSNSIVAEEGSPVFLHARLFETSQRVLDRSRQANLALGASINMAITFGLTPEEAQFGLDTLDTNNTVVADTCPQEAVCGLNLYRSLDGSCNNLAHREWGQAATAYQRIVAPDYADGMNAPRMSSTGGPLPSPRLLSHRAFDTRSDAYTTFTAMIMQWGQFLAHDFAHTPISKGERFTDITCCSRGSIRPPNDLHPECLPIEVPEDDPVYSPHGVRCMEFARSLPALRRRCTFGPREQMNQISAYIDASNVYGTSPQQAKDLREGAGGRLRAGSDGLGGELLPGDARALGCGRARQDTPCFKAGDGRVNEQPDLAVIHTVWLRQHNLIATELARINPQWVDEEVYQEARRLVAAQMQHITYNEYLPIVLGANFMTSFGLAPLEDGFSRYRPDVDATINNAFATAAFRYGHTLVPSALQGYSPQHEVDRDMTLSSSAFAPFLLYDRSAFESMLRGLAIQPSQKFDNKLSPELVNRLFAGRRPVGMDLAALNIQRGRDHGLPSYGVWRTTCHLPLARDFGDLSDVMSPESIRRLSSVYTSVDDIDLFVGGLMEEPVPGSLLGHTFLCIVGDQFARLKLGDRFFYENGDLSTSFTEEQLDEVRKTSLARVFCDAAPGVRDMQPLAFVQAGSMNPRSPCNDERSIPRISLEPWRA